MENKQETEEQIKPLFEDMFSHQAVENDKDGLDRAMMHQEKMKNDKTPTSPPPTKELIK